MFEMITLPVWLLAPSILFLMFVAYKIQEAGERIEDGAKGIETEEKDESKS